MAVTAKGFCHSPLWDHHLTVNTSDPDFTSCFQKTVLIWVPCTFLFLTVILRLIFLYGVDKYSIPWSCLSKTKLAFGALLGIIQLMEFLFTIQQYADNENVPSVNFVTPVVFIFSMLLFCFVVEFERRKGIRNCGFLFLFWLLFTLCGVVIFRSKIRHAVLDGNIEDPVRFALFFICYPVIVIQLVLSIFVDKEPMTEVEQPLNPCPENSASFLSRITFWWFTSLVIDGYKKALERKDLWALNDVDTSGSVVPTFDKYWQQEINKAERRNHSTAINGAYPRTQYKDGEVYSEVIPKVTTADGNKKYSPSLLISLIKTFGLFGLKAAFFKLIYDILQFVSPQLLKLLIKFTKNKDSYLWIGFLYAGCMFVVALVQSLILHQYFHGCFVLGMRLRTAIVAAVYRKTLRLSNAARKHSTVGEIVNLMSVDAQRFMDLMTYFHTIWSGPFQIAVSLYFLWETLGPSVLAGLGVMILLIPINAFIASKSKSLQLQQMNMKDQRIKLMNEILNGIKVLKLYAWEPSFQEKVLGIRNKELTVLKKAAYLSACSSFTWTCAPVMVSLTTFAVYTLSSPDNILDAEKAFVSLSLFNILRFPLSMLPQVITSIVQASVSLKRLNDFLSQKELDPGAVNKYSESKECINMKNSTFTWEADIEPTLRDINMEVEKGSLVAVVGAVGSGKSSLLSSLLGEMDKLSGTVSVKGSVAYVAQQPWIQNETLCNNVLFGRSFNRSNYDKIIYSCALQPDLEMLPAGDETEIGEKGINLSGGQKQRVSVARALYQNADVYLFDDPLSAVDSHVGKHIFDHVIGPEGLLRNKTRILVTHGINYLPKVDNIIVLVDGQISEVGSYRQLLDLNGAFATFLKNYLLEEVEGDVQIDDIENVELREEILSQLEACSESETSVLLRRSIQNLSQSKTSLSNSKKSLKEAVSSEVKKQKKCESESVKTVKQDDKLILAETVETGQVKLSVFYSYVKAVGPMLTVFIILFFVLYNGASIYSNVWLSEWSKDASEPNTTTFKDNLDMRLGVYGGLGILQGFFIFSSVSTMLISNILAARRFHESMLKNMIKAPVLFFDTTPVGRIINRFGKDIDVIDVTLPSILTFSSSLIMAIAGLKASWCYYYNLVNNLLRLPMVFYDRTPMGRIINRYSQDIAELDLVVPYTIRSMINVILMAIATLSIIIYATPYFTLILPVVTVFYIPIQRFYVATSRQLKRLESISRSPIYSHFGETITGASTIRAFGQQQRFISESENKVDENQVSYYPSITSNRWLAIRLEFLGNLIVFFASLFAVLGRDNLSPGIVGLSISYALNVTQTLNWMVRMTCELETNIVAVERVKEYADTPTEAEWIVENNRPPKDWPTSGVVEFSDYKVRYREGLDLVLKGINCKVKSGEKIGIVGRTGAGKSSLTLALFRIIESAEGSISIDGINIAEIGLHDLRSKLTIIPQDPVLFSGSLRMNLDPFEEVTDDALWQALDHAHLKTFVNSLPTKLDHECSEGGENLSVGQRQLLCLARALLRKSKILILDEATAAIDLETDDLIQATIRTEFEDCTVLTIAHRLNTILDYTRIMVLDAGCVKEFDNPQELLKDESSLFYSMAKSAGLV